MFSYVIYIYNIYIFMLNSVPNHSQVPFFRFWTLPGLSSEAALAPTGRCAKTRSTLVIGAMEKVTKITCVF